ncbi:hypothetical protein PRZ48_005379 [Zasmidium cellare]|uniref:Uncharacterized protein n=1 Tax=Zasmidium cellare TaxID=395010 RepID=A0ABR0ETR9_ZASCE|nr:hypothetical protein PRZ48_005379 [Zasmidium cellare]
MAFYSNFAGCSLTRNGKTYITPLGTEKIKSSEETETNEQATRLLLDVRPASAVSGQPSQQSLTGNITIECVDGRPLHPFVQKFIIDCIKFIIDYIKLMVDHTTANIDEDRSRTEKEKKKAHGRGRFRPEVFQYGLENMQGGAFGGFGANQSQQQKTFGAPQQNGGFGANQESIAGWHEPMGSGRLYGKSVSSTRVLAIGESRGWPTWPA